MLGSRVSTRHVSPVALNRTHYVICFSLLNSVCVKLIQVAMQLVLNYLISELCDVINYDLCFVILHLELCELTTQSNN
jgi:hypothetical protein